MSTSVNSDTGEVSISDTCQADSQYIVPDQKSTLCQADNTRSEPLLARSLGMGAGSPGDCIFSYQMCFFLKIV